MNILHLTPDFNYSDGRSYYVFLLLKYLARKNHNMFLCTNGGDSFDRIAVSGINYEAKSYLSSKVSFLKSVKFLSDIVKENKIEIIHSHHRYYELLAVAVSKALKRKVKTVFTSLSIVDKKYSIEYKSDLIIAVSKKLENILKKRFGVESSKLVLIPNFTDSEELKNMQKSIYSKEALSGKTNILAVGRFHKEKDFMTLLKALVKAGNKKIKLNLTGEGKEKNNYQNFISENSLNVEIFPPQRDLRIFYDSADICVLPSIRDPFPGFMLQSGLHNKAFIGSDTDGISELIVNGENGLLFRKGDSSELAEKINFFIEDKAKARKCAESLHKTITENFTEKQIIPEIEKQYIKLTA